MAGPGNTELSWTNSDPAAMGVVVERHEGLPGSGTFVDLPASKTTGAAKTTKDLTTAIGHEYTYRVAFWNTPLVSGGALQRGPWSQEVAITFPLAAPTAAPSPLSVQ